MKTKYKDIEKRMVFETNNQNQNQFYKIRRNIAAIIISLLIATTALFNTTTIHADVNLVEAQGNVAQEYIDRANEILNSLPDKMLQEFQNNGWKFYVTDITLASYYPGIYNSVMGRTVYDEKIIQIENRSKAIEESVLHEFGHYIDYLNGFYSGTEECINIYNAETDAFCSAFEVTFRYACDEFFAEGFYRYYNGDREILKENCPQLYSFVERILESYL